MKAKKLLPDSLCFLFVFIVYLAVGLLILTYTGLFARDMLFRYREREADIPKHKAFLEEDCSPDDQIRKNLTNLCYQRASRMKEDPALHSFFDTLEKRGLCTDDSCSIKKFGANTLPVMLWTFVITTLLFVLMGVCLFQRKSPDGLPFALHEKNKVA